MLSRFVCMKNRHYHHCLLALLTHVTTVPVRPIVSLSSTASSELLHNNRFKVLFDSTNNLHKCQEYHPEQPERITACVNALKEYHSGTLPSESGIDLDIQDFASEPTTTTAEDDDDGGDGIVSHVTFSDDELAHARSVLVRTHSEEYVKLFENHCRSSRQKRIEEGKSPWGFVGYVDHDTYLTTESYDICLRATAAWIRCVDLVLRDNQNNNNGGDNDDCTVTAMALTRPPGHHATKSRSNGFCVFNFAAAAAVHAVETAGLTVSVLDWDVHYGQGVSDILQRFPQTRYMSMHQTPAFPYEGETSGVSGEFGNIRTIPVPPGSNWGNGYRKLFEEQALPFVCSSSSGKDGMDSDDLWEPDLVIVCAGYDALLSDELASCSLTAKDFGRMTRLLRRKIESSNKPARLIFGLEGGYQLANGVQGGNLADAVVETVKAFGFSKSKVDGDENI